MTKHKATANETARVRCGQTETGSYVVGGCGEIINPARAFRCTDCLVPFHRHCANQHFRLDAYVKSLRELNAQGAIDDWKAAVAKAESERDQLLAEVMRLREALINIRDHEVDELDICDHGEWARSFARAAVSSEKE